MFNNLTKKVTVLITGVILMFLAICSISAHPEPNIQHPDPITQIVQVTTKHVTNNSDSLRSELVRQTNNYIYHSFPKSKLTGEALVMACEKHDFDICFALAQAEIESGFGTVGKAARTNSPWNVGAHDSRSAQTMNKLGYGYSHPDLSIEPYIELVKTKYLGTKRTVHDLMNRYVTLSGYRYASDPNYERTLRSKYRIICTRTTIRDIQLKLKRMS